MSARKLPSATPFSMTSSQVRCMSAALAEHFGEALAFAEVGPFVLVDGGGVGLLARHLERGEHEVVEAVGGGLPAGDDRGVVVLDGGQVAGQDLRDDRVL